MKSDENQLNKDLPEVHQMNKDLNEDPSNEDQWNEDLSENQSSEDSDSSESSEDSSDGQSSEDSFEAQMNDHSYDYESYEYEDQWDGDLSEDLDWNEDFPEDQDQWDEDFYEHTRNLRQNAIFEHVYRCFSVSSLDRPILENGDKIIMPASALDRLSRMNIEYPMLFELRNPSAERITHCGVLEFTADEGIVSLPNWMMEDMLLENGDIVSLKSTSLAKGKCVKLQPHTKDFLDMSNPKAVLEISLRSYSCLTTGRTIMIPYNNKKYYIDVVESKPCPAISIIETDCEVDFAPPLDYKEPEKHLPSDLSDKESPPLDYREPEKHLPSDLSDKESPQVEEEVTSKSSKVIPFIGLGRRLDGKASTQSVEPSSSPILKQQQTEIKSKSSLKTSGKLVFGSNANAPNVSLKSESQESPKKIKTPEFQAFTGKKYSLRD